MKNNTSKDIITIANVMLKDKLTVRETGKLVGLSKSTIHKHMHENLKNINNNLYEQVMNLFEYHKSIRHINGGLATRRKYEHLKMLKK